MTWKIIDVTISLSDTNGGVTCVKLILRNSLHNEYYNALRLFVCISNRRMVCLRGNLDMLYASENSGNSILILHRLDLKKM